MSRIDASGRGVFGKHGAKASYVYFVQAEQLGLIKIGIATCLYSRLKGLQTGSPDKLVLLGAIMPIRETPLQMEDRLHAKFGAARRHGEWFDPVLCSKHTYGRAVAAGWGGGRHRKR